MLLFAHQNFLHALSTRFASVALLTCLGGAVSILMTKGARS